MAININVKEIYATDNQLSLANKLNFNFNQFLSLGVGEKGDTGQQGPTGPIGPRGRTGANGQNGSTIWSGDPTVYIDLGSASPENSSVGDYYIGSISTGSVTYDGIYKKEEDSTWSVITDFSTIFRTALDVSGGELFPWRVGVNTQTPPARIIIPINNSQGTDRKTVIQLSQPSDYYETYTPNWQLNTTTSQNAQNIIFNFDVNTAKKIITSTSADSNGYTVKLTEDRLGSNISQLNNSFPYTSLLSLYSFYEETDASTIPDHLVDTIGYRHQFELGSIDNITEYLHSSDANDNYVISPTYQNLRVRKYRKEASDIPGKSAIFSDFILHSNDSVNDPALNSKFEWSINKKTASSYDNNTIIKFALSGSTLEGSSSSTGLTGLSVDGLHLLLSHPSSTYKFAIGFDPNNYTNLTKNIIAKSDGTIDTIKLDEIGLNLKSGTNILNISGTGLTSQTDTDLNIFATDEDNFINLGSSDTSIAIKIKGDKLASGIPFETSTGATPANSSSDSNTLDEYQEGTFTPAVYYGTLPTPATSVLTNNNPTVSNTYGSFVKIGKIVTFSLTFTLSDWTVVTTTGRSSGTHLIDPYFASGASDIDVGNLSNSPDGEWTTEQHELGNESYPIIIRDIPDHWPTPNNAEEIIFNVSIKPKIYNGYGMRPFNMDYSWTNSGTSSSSEPWRPIAPSTVKARFDTYEDGTTKPQLKLYGYREDTTSGRLFSTFESLVSIYDFLNYVHPSDPTDGNTVVITINGTYESNHQTAQDAYPIGVTTTTSTSTTTTTTVYSGPATTTTTSTSTTTTAAPTTSTTTTTASPYGSELMTNSGAPTLTDWINIINPDGLGDTWSGNRNYEDYSIISGLYSFSENAQQVVRQTAKTGPIAILSNRFAGDSSKRYRLQFKYRASRELSVLQVINLATQSYTTIDDVNAVTGSIYGSADIEFVSSASGFTHILFYMKTDGASGSTLWFQIDEVSLKEIL